jgi:hypothetical protein
MKNHILELRAHTREVGGANWKLQKKRVKLEEVLQGRGIRVPRQDQFIKATLIIQKYGTFKVQTGYYLLNDDYYNKI